MVESFLGYIRPTRKYSAVIYDDETQARLTEYCSDVGLDISKDFDGNPIDTFEFHTTIFMGKNPRFIDNKSMYWKGRAHVVDFDLFGENKDIPVAIIESQDILNVRKFFKDTLGEYDLTFPIFRPHVTLSYSRNLPDRESLKFIDFPLTFDRVVIRDAL